MSQFINGKFSSVVKPTLGVDFKFKKMEVPNAFGHPVDTSIALWDSAGAGFVHVKQKAFYSNASAILLGTQILTVF